MNRERLLNVAKALRESPKPEHFDMGTYGNSHCGTPACAFGHYAARPDLQGEFRLARVPEASSSISRGGCGTRYDAGILRVLSPAGKEIGYWDDSVLRHFGIDEDAADTLFCTEGCDGAETAVQAAEYIENFVARHGEVVS